MAQPVWVLSVDLQTKTATFQSGLADAAKAARGAFSDIKGGAGEMGRETGYSMMEARHSVMILGEEFGVHLPRALSTFIASIGPLGSLLAAAFPFAAIAVGATILLEHLAKMREAGEKLTDDQVAFGTAVNNAFNALDQKLIQAQIKAHELKNDHLGALKLQLELIDKQSMQELVHSFEEVAKAADVVLKDLEGHWYTIGIGSDGAKHALTEFKTEYESLLSQGKADEASGLLTGTLKQAQTTLDMMHQLRASRGGDGQTGDYKKYEEAQKYLERMGVLSKLTHDYTEGELTSQEAVVKALQAQVTIEGQVAALKKVEGGNASTQTGNEAAEKRAAGLRQAAESQLRMSEQSLAAEKTAADAQLTIHRGSLEERLAVDLEYAAKERDVKLAANRDEIAALDKNGKDYQNQLKGLQDKELEIKNEYATKAAELQSKASVDAYNRDLRNLQQAEREKIEATQQGSAARLAAIDSAIKEEEAKGLQDTSFFRDLQNSRVETARQAAEEEGKLRAEAAREDADNAEKMGALAVAAERQRATFLASARRASIDQEIANETRFANEEYQIKEQALAKEIAGLDKAGKDYENKLKQLQDKEKQLTQEHENELTSIKEKAEIERNQRILSAETRLDDSIARNLTQSIMGHQTWARTLISLGDQVVGGMIENAIKSMVADDMTKEKDAAAAARKAFNIGLSIGGPAGVILGPVFGAAAFAAVMAFAGGTDAVPGVGRGDIVPAMLSPGEGVVPGGVMDGLRNLARSGGFEQKAAIHVHGVNFAPTVHALDADGVDDVLTKHQDTFQKHFENTLRRLNK